MLQAADSLSNFAMLDVYLVAIFAIAGEFAQIIDAVGNSILGREQLSAECVVQHGLLINCLRLSLCRHDCTVHTTLLFMTAAVCDCESPGAVGLAAGRRWGADAARPARGQAAPL